MRLSEARCAIGRRVVYSPDDNTHEEAMIMRCSGTHVFLRCRGSIRAVSADELESAKVAAQ